MDTEILKILKIVEKEYAVELKEKHGILFDEYSIANLEKKVEEHKKHMKDGVFQRGCDYCANFLGHSVMSGRLQTKGDIKWGRKRKKSLKKQ